MSIVGYASMQPKRFDFLEIKEQEKRNISEYEKNIKSVFFKIITNQQQMALDQVQEKESWQYINLKSLILTSEYMWAKYKEGHTFTIDVREYSSFYRIGLTFQMSLASQMRIFNEELPAAHCDYKEFKNKIVSWETELEESKKTYVATMYDKKSSESPGPSTNRNIAVLVSVYAAIKRSYVFMFSKTSSKLCETYCCKLAKEKGPFILHLIQESFSEGIKKQLEGVSLTEKQLFPEGVFNRKAGLEHGLSDEELNKVQKGGKENFKKVLLNINEQRAKILLNQVQKNVDEYESYIKKLRIDIDLILNEKSENYNKGFIINNQSAKPNVCDKVDLTETFINKAKKCTEQNQNLMKKIFQSMAGGSYITAIQRDHLIDYIAKKATIQFDVQNGIFVYKTDFYEALGGHVLGHFANLCLGIFCSALNAQLIRKEKIDGSYFTTQVKVWESFFDIIVAQGQKKKEINLFREAYNNAFFILFSSEDVPQQPSKNQAPEKNVDWKMEAVKIFDSLNQDEQLLKKIDERERKVVRIIYAKRYDKSYMFRDLELLVKALDPTVCTGITVPAVRLLYQFFAKGKNPFSTEILAKKFKTLDELSQNKQQKDNLVDETKEDY